MFRNKFNKRNAKWLYTENYITLLRYETINNWKEIYSMFLDWKTQ